MKKFASVVLVVFVSLFTIAANWPDQVTIERAALTTMLSSDAAINDVVRSYDGATSWDSDPCYYRDGNLHTANYYARGWYFGAVLPKHSEEIYTLKETWQYSTLTNILVSSVRSFLKDPDNLMGTYLAAKSKLILGFVDKGQGAALSRDIARWLPMLDGTFKKADRQLLLKYKQEMETIEAQYPNRHRSPDEQELQQKLCLLRQQIRASSNGSITDPQEALMTYEWIERRRKEGGDKLVSAYAWVAKDMISSLGPQ